MNNIKLAGQLREFCRRTNSGYKKQIFRQAARRIEEQGKLLKKARDLMLRLEKILPERDYDCVFCDHEKDERPCFKSDDFPECAECPRDCFCKDCTVSNSKWVNSVMREIIVKVGGSEPRNDRGENENAEREL